MAKLCEGRVCIVTGAGRGIGRGSGCGGVSSTTRAATICRAMVGDASSTVTLCPRRAKVSACHRPTTENSDANGTDGCNTGPAGSNSIRDLASFSSRGPQRRQHTARVEGRGVPERRLAASGGEDWFGRLEPHTGGYYTNIEYEGEAAAGNYGPAYPRLSRIKARHDPMNLFRLNSNIEPV